MSDGNPHGTGLTRGQLLHEMGLSSQWRLREQAVLRRARQGSARATASRDSDRGKRRDSGDRGDAAGRGGRGGRAARASAGRQ
jgi:hypothetical protein